MRCWAPVHDSRQARKATWLCAPCLRSHWIYETPAVWVTHHGHRTWEQLPALIHNYWQGTGAMMAKPFKIAPWRILPLLLRLAGKWAVGHSAVGASLGPRQRRLRKLWSFGTGFLAGAFLLVDESDRSVCPFNESDRARAKIRAAGRSRNLSCTHRYLQRSSGSAPGVALAATSWKWEPSLPMIVSCACRRWLVRRARWASTWMGRTATVILKFCARMRMRSPFSPMNPSIPSCAIPF